MGDGLNDGAMSRPARELSDVSDRVGCMNRYGSEGPNGPTAKDRERIKKDKEHGLLLSSLNKNSIQSARHYMTDSKADISFVQELNQKIHDFYITRSAMLKGTYMNVPCSLGAAKLHAQTATTSRV